MKKDLKNAMLSVVSYLSANSLGNILKATVSAENIKNKNILKLSLKW